MKKTALFLTAILLSAVSFSQSGSITGRLTDSSTRKILPLATVTVFKAKDTSIVTYRLSNQEGIFKVTNLPLEGIPSANRILSSIVMENSFV